MDIRILEGQNVNHKSWGTGIVKKINDMSIEIEFKKQGIKKFQFPQAFDKFLKIDDETLQKDIMLLEKERAEKKAAEKKPKPVSKVEKYQRDYIRLGDSFSTHAEALNECFGFEYKHFQKGFKELNDEYAVWFPNIARQVLGEYVSTDKSLGWINILADGGKTIIQIDRTPSENPSDNSGLQPKYHKDRIIFAKFDGEDRYRFIGIFDFGERVDNGYKGNRIGTIFDTRKMKIVE